MKRIIEHKLMAWKDDKYRKPLIIRGMRQIGKTWSVKRLGETAFNTTVIIDFEKHPEYCNVFNAGSLEPVRICSELEILTGERIRPGETLLFLDEIQQCPKAIMALRYFYEDMPELHVIAAGSLLEFAFKDISVPVGRISFLPMHPMGFSEYLAACGHDEAARIVTGKPGPVSSAVHEFISGELKKFIFTGGMPACVDVCRQTGSLARAMEVQADLVNAFRMDFSKYSPRTDPHCLDAVLAGAARMVGRQTKYTSLAEGYTNPTLKKAYETLCRAQILRKVPSVNPPQCPLEANASPKFFKTIFSDIGIMQNLAGLNVADEYRAPRLMDMYRGALAEQFVGQELALARDNRLYYWSRQARSSSAEVDYIFATDGSVRAVEVKSGAAGRFRSLRMLLNAYPGNGPGLVIAEQPYREEPDHNIIRLPLYSTFGAAAGPDSPAIF